ncbi:hypothetical protein ABZ154_00305 [Streptomyces sp. NPDC006261]|uniref:hypothetical protein n=1 Tax=Streptomyces sp. NPDC006261 TaxID=3156739 RepID=UPI0033BC2389
MFDFGVAGYRPAWLHGRREVVREQGLRLHALEGRTLTRVWAVWDLRDDAWFSDCPVLLDFEGEQVEINHHRFDDLSITWNGIDPGSPVRWPGFALEWRQEPLDGLKAPLGLPLLRTELLEWTGGGPARGVVDVSFVFEAHRISVFNALDENGLSFAAPGTEQRAHRLG